MQLCWNIRGGTAATDHPSPAEPQLWPGPSPDLPIQCPVLTPLWTSKQVQSERWGWGPPGQPGISLLPSAECKRGAPTCYESLLENLDERCPELAGECHRRAPGGGCAFPPAPHRQDSWAFQRSCAGCRACPPGRWLEKARRHSAWPPGARPSFTAPKGGLPAVWDPLAGAESQVRRRHGSLRGCSCPSQGTDVCERWTPMATPLRDTHVYPQDGRHYIQRQVPTIPLEAKCLHKGRETWNRAWHTVGAQCRAAE